MAEKLPVIIENRRDNTLLCAFGRFLSNPQKLHVAAPILKSTCVLLVEVPGRIQQIRVLASSYVEGIVS